jgi:hypothetical protein
MQRGAFAGPAILRAPGTTLRKLAGDLNGDAFVDLRVPGAIRRVVTVSCGDGSALFGEDTSYATGPSPRGRSST